MNHWQTWAATGVFSAQEMALVEVATRYQDKAEPHGESEDEPELINEVFSCGEPSKPTEPGFESFAGWVEAERACLLVREWHPRPSGGRASAWPTLR